MKYKNVIKKIVEMYLYNDMQEQLDRYAEDNEIWEFLIMHRLDMIFYDLILDKNKIPFCMRKRYQETKKTHEKMESVIQELEIQLNGIPIIFLKGVALSFFLYKEKYHRSYHDIDILVERKNITCVEKALLRLGYQYGYEYKGEIYSPSRKEIVLKQLYSHECCEMVKIHKNGLVSYVDVNFLFSWRVSNEKVNEKFVSDLFNESNRKEAMFNTLDWEHMLIHLCCHFYNEAHYLENDPEYHEERDKSIILSRLLDIILILHLDLDYKKVKDIVDVLKCEKKMIYVIYAIKVLVGYDYTWMENYLESTLDDEIINGYYTKDGKLCFHSKTIVERVYG